MAVINGTSGNDSRSGTSGNDTISLLAGNDRGYGLGGNDTLYGGEGNDSLYGGNGSDRLWGGNGNDLMQGDAGDDRLFGEAGNDTLFGGAGNDAVHGDDGNDTVQGDAGNDFATGGNGNDTVYGGVGNDTLHGNDGADRLFGDAGNDTLNAGNGDDTTWGGDGHDYVLDLNGRDVIDGGAGNDRVITLWFEEGIGTGLDQLTGGDGDDDLAGIGMLDGGTGNDWLSGYGTLLGGSGNDFLDKVYGPSSSLYGGDGDDVILANEGDDQVFGGNGIDTYAYGSYFSSSSSFLVDLALGSAMTTGETDRLYSIENASTADGNDTILGANGTNVLDGGDGNDTLDGRDGDDTLYGGFGSDRFIYGNGDDLMVGHGGLTIPSTREVDVLDYSLAPSRISMGAAFGPGLLNAVSIQGAAGVLEVDRFIDIEHVIGTRFDDYMTLYAYGETVFAGRYRLDGMQGNDVLYDGARDDELRGGSGNDRLVFYNGGRDRAYGDGGADVFELYSAGASISHTVDVMDFTRSVDKLSIRDGHFPETPAAEIFARLDSNSNGMLDHGDATVILGELLIDGARRSALTVGISDGTDLEIRLIGVSVLTLDDFI